MSESLFNQTVIKTNPEFSKTPGFVKSPLTDNEKSWWCKVCEVLYPIADKPVDETNLPTVILKALESQKIYVEKYLLDEDEEDDGPEPAPKGKGVRKAPKHGYRLTSKMEQSTDVIAISDEEKQTIYEAIHPVAVARFRIDWLTFHYGLNVAALKALQENAMVLMTEATMPLTGDPDKREQKLSYRTQAIQKLPGFLEDINSLRFKLFGVSENQLRRVESANPMGDIVERRKNAKESARTGN